MRAAVAVIVLAGCGYKPSSFSHFDQGFPGKRVSVGCLDLAVNRRADTLDGGPVLAYEFGNRCDHPATIDLGQARVLGQTVDGQRIELTPYDPNGEIRPLKIDGRTAGAEALAYPADATVTEICVDAASIAHEQKSLWLCFDITTAPALAEVRP